MLSEGVLCACLFVGVSALYPDVVLVDGNGVLHPRGCGLACYLGLVTHTPTIGSVHPLFSSSHFPTVLTPRNHYVWRC